MKTASLPTLLLLAFALALVSTGCKKTPKSPTPIWGRAPSAPTSPASLGGLEQGMGSRLPADSDPRAGMLPANPDDLNALPPRESLGDYFMDRDAFRQQTIYFGFDEFNVRQGELSKAQSVAEFLRDNPYLKVLVEGHCDERGTPEYNRALGERRALSVRETLVRLGLSGDRVQTISYGEDRPADPDTSEAAFARNRRGEFILLTPKDGATAAQAR